MDSKKIGSFLKGLRKEKNLSQEQLAEQLDVSGRTVSRWETGSNMPDISMLVELAEFYELSITEIIDGERKSEKMNEEVKEAALKISDYSAFMDKNVRNSLFWFTIIALIGTISFAIIEVFDLATPNSIYEGIAAAGIGLSLGMLICMAIYLSGVIGKKKENR